MIAFSEVRGSLLIQKEFYPINVNIVVYYLPHTILNKITYLLQTAFLISNLSLGMFLGYSSVLFLSLQIKVL